MTAYEGSLDVRDGLRLRGLGVNEENLLAKTDAEDPGITWLRLRERIQGIALRKQAEAKEMQTLKRENRYLRETVAREVRTWILSQPLSVSAAQIESDPDGHLGDQIGRSFVMKEVFRRLRRAAVLPSDVLILGPTGTGKDLVARSIHKLSARANQPFVKADLTTTTQNLLESELFGHERGAFTGADARKEGLLALADKGTFFLDEIGQHLAGSPGEAAARARGPAFPATREPTRTRGRRARDRRDE
jgi:transcriptional regulator with GAF, ATPase, and Fis domain